MKTVTNDISAELKDCFTEDTVLVTDSHSAYRGFAKTNGKALLPFDTKGLITMPG